MNNFLNHLLKEFHLPLTNPVLVFSIMLFIILLSPILLRKARIPGIIGLILSGIIIGPKGFGIIGALHCGVVLVLTCGDRDGVFDKLCRRDRFEQIERSQILLASGPIVSRNCS